MPNSDLPRDARTAILRITAAIAPPAAFPPGTYALLDATRPDNGLINFAFLLVLPAAISAFLAYVADPWRRRSLQQYLLVPVWLLLAVIVLSLVVLHEGVICVILLTPLWLGSALIGAGLTYKLRHRLRAGRTYCAALLALPLVAIQLEPLVPLPEDRMMVTRAIEIAAPPARIWPFLRGIPDVQPGEGAWNVTQDVIGVPRPLGAWLVGDGLGADREARWAHNVAFRETITEWQEDVRIGWHFVFDDVAAWDYTDRHLMPNSRYFGVTDGRYRMEPLGPNRTRLFIDTEYRIQTPVNAYCALWGEFFLGDVENNLLAMIRQRA